MKEAEAERLYGRILRQVEKELGNDTTYGSTLTTVGKELFGNRYRGTFASNEVPPPLLVNGEYCIINLDKTWQEGSHWVGCVYDNNRYYFYDSFGRPGKQLKLEALEGKKVIDADLDPEQLVSQTNCGQRCLAWLWFADRYGVDNALLI